MDTNEEYRSPAVKIILLKRNLRFLEKNYDELINLLDKYKDPEYNEALWTTLPIMELDNYAYDVSRRLINFVAMASMLVDINRRMMRKWYKEETEFYQIYSGKVNDSFTQNPLIQFVQNLRNYTLHYELLIPNLKPPKSVQQDLSEGNHGVVLRKSRLLKSECFNGYAKQFLQEPSSYIENDYLKLDMIIKEYYRQISTFYSWLFESLETDLRS